MNTYDKRKLLWGSLLFVIGLILYGYSVYQKATLMKAGGIIALVLGLSTTYGVIGFLIGVFGYLLIIHLITSSLRKFFGMH